MTSADRAAWRSAAAIAAGVGAAGAAAWLVPASVHIARWTTSGPTRVALLAPAGRLEWIGAAAAIVLIGILAWTRGNRDRLASAAARIAPLSVLWLWVVPFLPWLPDRIPLLLMLAGPIRWAFAAVAVGAAIGMPRLFSRMLDVAARFATRRTVFAISLAAYIGFGGLWARTIGIGGDEPHYLMIAQSLLVDGDLRIENNHDNGEYRSFFGGPLRPDFMVRGKNGLIYSIHAPGLSVLLLPAYAIGGYPASLVFLCVISALMAVAVFDLADALAGRRAALFTWLAICFTVPFVPAAWLVYPDSVGALIVAWAALWVWKPLDARARTCFWRGVVFATLPWFHTKFVVLLVVFAGALAFRLRRHVRAVVVLAAPIVVSLMAWLWFFHVIYGVFDPQAPYGDYTLQLHMKNVPRSLLGLLFDQKFGLLFYSPVYVAAIGGWWAMMRRSNLRYLGLVLLVAVATFTGGSARMYMWWGGSSAPARFLVPFMPCLGPMIAIAFASTRRRWTIPVYTACLLVSVGIALTAAFTPELRLIYSDPHGFARLLLWLQAGAPLAASFPTFTSEDWRTPAVALLPWVAAAMAAAGTIAIVSRAERRSMLQVGVVASIVFLLVAGVGTARPEAALRDDAARSGALELLWRWDPVTRRAVRYGANAQLDASALAEISAIAWHGPAQPVALPTGTYEARVWFAGGGAREGEIRVTAGANAVFGRAAGLLQNPTTIRFELPSDAPRVEITVPDARLAARVVNAEIVPLAVVPVGARDGRTVRAVESIPDAPAGYIIYIDTTTYPEGGAFWTRGTDPTTVLVAPGGASRITVTMFLGPLSGDVRLSVAGKESRVHVAANSVAEVETDLPPGKRLVPVQIQAPGQFRPADTDPRSDDTRRLGCQVRFALE